MQASKIMGLGHTHTIDIQNLDQLEKLALTSKYSLGVFSKGQRRLKAFKRAFAVGIDFDSGMTLEEAKLRFSDYEHLIMPTKSHQKDKNGVVCDRFRVILPLSSPIEDVETFKATYDRLLELFPQADHACKDASRYWDPSIDTASKREGGRRLDPVKPGPKLELVRETLKEKTRLSKKTSDFFINGAPKGKRHGALLYAASDARENGYTMTEVIEMVEAMSKRTRGIDWPHDGHMQTIRDVFENREMKYGPRVEEKAFSFMPIGELFERNVEIDWIVDRLLSKGGMSIFAGSPKSGKSTLVRQLVANVCRGTNFLSHRCKTGPVLYLALEEQDAMLKSDFKLLGITKDDDITIHIGGPMTMNAVEELAEVVEDRKPILTVVDTLFHLSNVKNTSDYQEVNVAMARLRKIARDTGTHVLCVHHAKKPNKEGGSSGGDQILGSTALFGAVDMALVIKVKGKDREIETRGRGVMQYDRPIIFDPKTQTYTLGALDIL